MQLAPNLHRDVNRYRININEPRWDQGTYWGRAKHFFVTTNPLNLLCTPEELDKAKDIVTKYKKGKKIPGLTEDKLWRAKHIYDSAFHPDSGEKMILIGRMSAQVPMNMTIIGCMLTFYKTSGAVVFWQWFNQSFNAVVNFSNRSGHSPTNDKQLAISYVLATSGALITALGLNSLVKKAPPIIGRFVPFTAVAAANCINIPVMRAQELQEGILVTDKYGKRLGYSAIAAKDGITQTVISRIGMAIPGMVLSPILMNSLERKGVLSRFPSLGAPIQILICGFCLTFATPLCCALFAQRASMPVSDLEPELQRKFKYLRVPPKVVYYNKGL